MGRYFHVSFLVLLLILAGATSVRAQASLKMSGTVLNARTRQPLPSASIIRVSDRRGTLSNENGKFSIYVKPGDTLLVRSVGFKPLFYLVHPSTTDDLREDILLQEGSHELPEVKVIGGLDYEKVNRALRNIKKPVVTKKVPVKPPAPKPLFEEKPQGPPPPPTLENPASLLFDLLSKEGKDRRKLEARMEEEAARKKALEEEKKQQAYDSLFLDRNRGIRRGNKKN